MQKPKISLSIAITIFLMYAVTCSVSAGEPGSTAFNFLKIGEGVRASGLGGAFTAVADDVSALYWNPGGLNKLNRDEASFMHARWFEDISFQSISIAHSIRARGALGLNISRLSKDGIQGYDAGGSPTSDNLTFSDTLVALAYAYPLRIRSFNFSGGITAKYIREKIADEKASGIAFDVGLLSKLSVAQLPIHAGITLRNMGSSITFIENAYDLPRMITVGVSTALLHERLTASIDYRMPNDNDQELSLGSEYRVTDFLTARLGCRTKVSSSRDDAGLGLTAGMGIGNADMHIDYAFIPYDDLGDTHRFGLTVRFGKQYQLDSFQKRINDHLAKANTYLHDKNIVLAYREIQFILELSPHHVEALALKDTVTSYQNTIETAEHIQHISYLIQKNQLLEAREEAQALLAVKPDCVEAKKYLEDINAQFSVEKQQRIKALLNQAQEFMGKDACQDAIDLYEKILLIEPDNEQAAESKTKAESQLKYQKLLFKKKYLGEQFKTARVLYHEKKLKESVRILQEILGIDREYPDAVKLLAEAEKELHIQQETDAEPSIQEGITHFRENRLKEAYASFKQALEIFPDSEKAQQNLLKVKTLLNALNKEKAQELNRNGLAAYSEGDIQKAITYFEEALALYPSYEEAQKNLSRVKQEVK